MKKSMAHGSKKWRGHAKRIIRDGVAAHNRTFEEAGLNLRVRVVRKGKPVHGVRVDPIMAADLDELIENLKIANASRTLPS